jgi:hypothetical protein
MKVKATIIYRLRYEAEVILDTHDVTGFKFPINCSQNMDENPILFDEIVGENDEVLQQLPIPEEKEESDIPTFYVEDSFEVERVIIHGLSSEKNKS